MSRHIPPDQRTTKYRTITKTSPRSGKTRTRRVRPRPSLRDKLTNLHTLLRVDSFGRWPLNVKFLAPDVFRAWDKLGKSQATPLRDGIGVDLAELAMKTSSVKSSASALALVTPEVLSTVVDVTYASWKPHFEKSRLLLASPSGLECHFCKAKIVSANELAVICPCEGCETVSHVSCMANHFLVQEANADLIVPTTGECPGCHSKLNWQELVRDLSLRIRGDKESAILLKKRRQTKLKEPLVPAGVASSPKMPPLHTAHGPDEQSEHHVDGVDSSHATVPVDVNINSTQVAEDDWIFQQMDDDDEVSNDDSGRWVNIDDVLADTARGRGLVKPRAARKRKDKK